MPQSVTLSVYFKAIFKPNFSHASRHHSYFVDIYSFRFF